MKKRCKPSGAKPSFVVRVYQNHDGSFPPIRFRSLRELLRYHRADRISKPRRFAYAVLDGETVYVQVNCGRVLRWDLSRKLLTLQIEMDMDEDLDMDEDKR